MSRPSLSLLNIRAILVAVVSACLLLPGAVFASAPDRDADRTRPVIDRPVDPDDRDSILRSNEEDGDLPPFVEGKISKADYLRKRDAHIGRLRGVFDEDAITLRGRAIRTMLKQASSQRFSLNLNSSSWTALGPAPIPNGQTTGVTNAVSGRVTTAAIKPGNSNIVYVGTAQGGVYRTTDGGSTWTSILDQADSLAIGSIAIDPITPTTIFVGTGEANQSADSFFGVGVYRVTNAETSPTATLLHLDASNAEVFKGRSISKVVVDPANDNIIYVATGSGIGGVGADVLASRPNRGVFKSVNALGAGTFAKLNVPTGSANCIASDLALEPGSSTNIVVGIQGQGTGICTGNGGIWRSIDSGANWSHTQTIADGNNAIIGINKVVSTVTVLEGTSESNGTVRRSTDGGVTWSAALAAATGFCGGQCFYDLRVVLDPADASIIYLAGSAVSGAAHILIKSTNSGLSFSPIEQALHSDSHVVEIDPSGTTATRTIYFGSDGGIWKSVDSGAFWVSKNTAGFNATQFQSLALHPTDTSFLIGGTQDNGTEWLKPDGTWTRADYGDGGFALIDQNATDTTNVTMYHTYFNQVGAGGLVGFGRTTNTSTMFENWSFFGCGGANNGLTCTDSAVLFYAPMALGPGNPNTLYFGTDKIYRSTNSGTNMTAVSQVFASGFAVSAIGIAPLNDQVRLVGLENGRVFKTTTGSSTLTECFTDGVSAAFNAAKYVARTVIDPKNSNVAYVVFSGYDIPGRHIWKTTNLTSATTTWTAIDGTVPDVPVNAFAINYDDTNIIYAGTDIGVYRSSNGGTSWVPYDSATPSLPKVAVFDMAYQRLNGAVRIATHGRGIWEISDCPVPAIVTGVTASSVGNSVQVSWTGNGSSIYKVLRSTISGGSYTLIGSTSGTTYSDVNIANGVTYYYVVQGANSCATAANSTQASVVASTACNTAPTFAGSTTATAAGGGCIIDVSWGAASSNCNVGVSYVVYRGTTLTFVADATTRIAQGLTTTSYTDSNGLAKSGSTYFYKIGAVDASNSRETLNVVSGGVALGGADGCNNASATRPAAISVFTATATSSQAALRWTPPASGTVVIRVNTCGASCSFPASSSTGGAGVTLTAGQQSAGAVTVGGLTNGTSYYFSLFNTLNGFDSPGYFVKATPIATGIAAGNVTWMFHTAASAVTAPAFNVGLFSVSNDRILHSMGPLQTGGNWPVGWTPFAMNGPSQGRPNAINTVAAFAGLPNPVVFMGSQDGFVYAANGSTGASIWRKTTTPAAEMIQGTPMYFGHTYTTPNLPADLVVVGTRNSGSDNQVVGMDAATGNVLWNYTNSTMGVVNGFVSFDTANKNVYFATRSKGGTGNTLWAIHFNYNGVSWDIPTFLWSKNLGDIDSSPARVGSRIYVGNNVGEVFALDLSGNLLWSGLASSKFVTNDGPVKGLISADFGTNSAGFTNLYFATSNKVWALADKGTTASAAAADGGWTLDPITNSFSFPSIPVFNGTYVLFGTNDGKLFEIGNPRTGTPSVNSILIKSGNEIVGSPTFNGNAGANLIYAGTDAGTVYAVTPK